MRQSASRCQSHFYPRSPCGERRKQPTGQEVTKIFLSTLSLRRATTTNAQTDMGRTLFLSTLSLRRATARNHCLPPQAQFLSTLSLRRATICMLFICSPSSISIHALLAESDQSRVRVCQAVIQFLSTLSLRRATEEPLQMQQCKYYFYPRSPCGERL